MAPVNGSKAIGNMFAFDRPPSCDLLEKSATKLHIYTAVSERGYCKLISVN